MAEPRGAGVESRRQRRNRCRRWLLLALLMSALPAMAAAAAMVETPRMRRLGVVEGLPSRMVLALAQDRQGYVWAATDDGLARFDGRDFKVWRHDPQDAGSLPANSVETLLVDPLDRVWAGTNGGGLAMLEPGRATLRRMSDVQEHCPSQLWSLGYAEDALWVGTSASGLCRRGEDGRIQRFRAAPGDPAALPSDTIYTMVTDREGRLWIGTDAGLVRREGGRFVRIAPQQLGTQSILKLSIDPDGTLWIGSANGLMRLLPSGTLQPAPWPLAAQLRAASVVHDRHGGYWVGAADGLFRDGDGTLQAMTGDRGSGFLTANSGVLDILQDREGGLWLGLISQGLAYLPPRWQRFSTFQQVAGESVESLYMIAVAAQGDDFLVAGAQGVYRLGADGVPVRVAGLDRLGKGSVRAVMAMPDGTLWLGRSARLTWYDPASGRRRDLPTGFGDEPFRLVDLLRAAPDGGFWMSVMNGGVQHRAADGRVLTSIAAGSAGLPHADAEQLRITPDGLLWVAAGGTLLRWDGQRFQPVPGLEAGALTDFAFVGSDRVWAARQGGLERYRWDGARLRLEQRLGAAQGMPATEIGGLVALADGTLWATTPRGLVLHRPGQAQVRVIVGGDEGLPDSEFSIRPPAVNAAGQVLALTPTTLVAFDPARRLPPLPVAPLVIADIGVRRDDGAHPQVLDPALPVTLRADDRDLRIGARLLSYVQPARTQYRFRVAGYDRDWVEQGAAGERVLSRLPAGSYRVEVQGRALQGAWSHTATVPLEVLPPWWRTPPALMAVVALVVLLLVWLGHAWRRRLEARQQWRLSRQRQELAEHASLAKTRFLATLGHEVRTPMTGVLGMSELLLASPMEPRQRAQVVSIQQAGLHLLRLVDDALDLSRIEAGKLVLESQPFLLRPVLEALADFAAPLAQARGLEFRRALTVPEDLVVDGDVTRVRQVLMNLLNNAIKFTERGSVGLAAELADDGLLRFEVSDTGPGIDPAQQTRLFQRFEQGEGARTASRYGGSGLGLAICRELTLSMQGSIRIDSEPGRGTRFAVELPLPHRRGPLQPVSPLPPERMDTALRLLLVEDDDTVAEVIAGLLATRGHEVVRVAHGLAALAEISAQAFDVALLDLDLPGLDGLALARQLRALGQRLPLLAVTARADADAEAQALAAGFDGFVRKPVTAALLASTLASVLGQRIAAQAARHDPNDADVV